MTSFQSCFAAGVLMLIAAWGTPDACRAADGMDARRTQMLQKQLQSTYPRDGFWHYEDRAIAAYYLGQNSLGDKAILDELAEFNKDPKLEHFHWHAYMLERIYFLFSEHGRLPGRMSAEAEQAVVDMLWQWAEPRCFLEMTVSEKDWWIWGSENHHLQAWISAWGAAQIFAARPQFKDKTYLDGTSMPDMAKAFDGYFKRWLRHRATSGLFVECASGYNRYALGPLSNIHDFAVDPALQHRAKLFLDLYWADWAIEQLDGLRGGSRHRCYPGRDSFTESSVEGEAWYLFGIGRPASAHPSVMCVATSFYRPPPLVTELALNAADRGSYAYVSRRPGRGVGTVGAAKRAFVDDPRCAFHEPGLVYWLDPQCPDLLRYTWCTPDFIMGTSMVPALPNKAWTNISSQNRWYGVIFAGHPTARLFTQPPLPRGDASVYNDSWSVQSKGVMIVQRLKSAANARGQRVWFDEALVRTEKDGWVFAQAPRAYAAVRVLQGATTWSADDQPYRATARAVGKGMWLDLADEFSPILIEVAQPSAYENIDAFQRTVLSNALSWDGTKVEYSSSGYQTTVALWADYSQPPQVDGRPVNYAPPKVYDSPYLESDFGSGVVTIRKGEDKLELDFNRE